LCGRSALWRRGRDRDLPRIRLIAKSCRTLLIVTFALWCAILGVGRCFALVGTPIRVVAALLLLLLRRLVHRVQNAEIVLGVLEEAFRLHPVSAAGRVAAKLEVFLKKLLGGATDADIRPIAVEDVVAVQRNPAALVADSAAATASAATTSAATAGAMVAATHAFHVHAYDVALSHCGLAKGAGGRSFRKPGRIRLVGH
jgi:hypothetical protein